MKKIIIYIIIPIVLSMVMVTSCSLPLTDLFSNASSDSGDGKGNDDGKPKFPTFLPTWALEKNPHQRGVNIVPIHSIGNGRAGVAMVGIGDTDSFDIFSSNGIHLKFIGFGTHDLRGRTIEQAETDRIAAGNLYGRIIINITPKDWEVTAMTDWLVTYQTKHPVNIPITHLGGYGSSAATHLGATVKYKGSMTFYNSRNSALILNDVGWTALEPDFKIVSALVAYNPLSGAVTNNPLHEYLRNELGSGGHSSRLLYDEVCVSGVGSVTNNNPAIIYIEFF